MQKSNGILYVMCGMPGSGKSYFAEEITKAVQTKLISRDEIRFSMLKENDEYFAKENLVFSRFMELINKALKNDYSVIADATHLTPGSRRKLLSNLTVAPSSIVCFYFDLPFDVCLSRNETRSGRKFVPKDVMESMYKNFKIPTYSEGFDYIYKVNNTQLILQSET